MTFPGKPRTNSVICLPSGGLAHASALDGTIMRANLEKVKY